MEYKASSVAMTPAATTSKSLSKPLQLAAAMILGLVFLYGAGFAPISAVHNAAHDVRHAQAFPCH